MRRARPILPARGPPPGRARGTDRIPVSLPHLMANIFLVEQDPALREWCRLHLGSEGHSVTAFDDGRRALEALRLDTPDLLLIATNLLGVSAFALAASVRRSARFARTPIVFFVPKDDAAARGQAEAIDAEGILVKPFTREMLVRTVASRLGTAQVRSAGEKPAAPAEAGPAAGAARGTASGPLLETKHASVLVVGLRNFVSLARTLSAAHLDRFLAQYAAGARQAVFDAGGWIVSADALSMVALFEDVPDHSSPHSSRAMEAAMGVVLAARAAKRWGEANLPNRMSIDVSVGCGIHAGEVIIARLTVGGHLAPSIAGLTADLARRLEGRARGLRWSVACSEAAFLRSGSRFEPGYRSSLTDSDHGATIPIVEIRGFQPGSAKPGELARMGEIREAMLANSLLAALAGDVAQDSAERTLMVRPTRTAVEKLPVLPGRHVERRIRQSASVEAFVALNHESQRREIVKVIAAGARPAPFVEAYLEDYRNVASIQQRNVAIVNEVAGTPDLALVALEFLGGGSLSEAMHRQLSVGASLNCVAQACMALDGLHAAGIVHGELSPDHFHFRADGALVLSDFNTSRRIERRLGETGAEGGQPRPARARDDFEAVGRILHALLTGDRMLLGPAYGASDAAEFERASRLPLPLSPIQPCLDGLLGVGGQAPIDQAQDVLVALMGVVELFPFDARANPYSGDDGRARPTP